MIMLNANKQPLKYALFNGSQEITKSGEQETWTNPITGEVYNLDNTTGDSKPIYGEVVEITANISLGNNKDEFEAYGFSQSDYNGTIAASRNEFPINVGTLIWYESEVKYKQSEIDPKSADYYVVGIIPSLNEVKYLIKGVV